MPQPANVESSAVTISPGPRMKAALILAIAADIFQIAIFPFVFEGAASPANDVLDLCVAGLLSALLGWHWEFAPSFLAKLVPGVEFVPLWTLAVANVYRKSKPHIAAKEAAGSQQPSQTGARQS